MLYEVITYFGRTPLHELSLTQNLIEIAEEHARREGAKAITCITMEIGALSGVIPEAVITSYSIHYTKLYELSRPRTIWSIASKA